MIIRLSHHYTTPAPLILHLPAGDTPASLADWPSDMGRSTTALPYGVRYYNNWCRLHKAHGTAARWWIDTRHGRIACTLAESAIPQAALAAVAAHYGHTPAPAVRPAPPKLLPVTLCRAAIDTL